MSNDPDGEYEARPHDNKAAIATTDALGMEQVRRQHETAGIAVAAKLKAAIQARYLVAMERPRNLMVTRETMLEHCKRSAFAEAAWFSKPKGGKPIEGLSVRFAEQALQAYKNAEVSAMVLFDDDDKRIFRVESNDFESNTGQSVEVTISKTTERRQLRQGETPIRSRINSFGDRIYIMPATEDDITQKQGAEIAKARRNLIIMMLPADIVEECKAAIKATRASEVTRDPASERKKLLDGFLSLGVRAEALGDYLAPQTLDTLSPVELVSLRAMWVAIKEGETRWSDIVEAKNVQHDSKPDEAAMKRAAETKAKLAEATEKLKKKVAPAKAEAPKPEGPRPGVDEPPADFVSK